MAFFMRHVARLNHAKGWVAQLHLVAFRDPNPPLTARLGADVESGRLPGRRDWLDTLVADVCCRNARALFGGGTGARYNP